MTSTCTYWKTPINPSRREVDKLCAKIVLWVVKTIFLTNTEKNAVITLVVAKPKDFIFMEHTNYAGYMVKTLNHTTLNKDAYMKSIIYKF